MMNRLTALRVVRRSAIYLILCCVGVASLTLWHSAAVERNKSVAEKQEFNARLREADFAAHAVAQPGDHPDNVRAATNSVAQFIFSRSGVRLGGPAKDRLAELEAQTIVGARHRLTGDELSDVLSGVAQERIAALSDAQISHAAEVLRGFDAPDLPDSFRRGRAKVKLRASKAGGLSPEQFVAQAKALRGADDASRAIFKGALRTAIGQEINDRLTYLHEANPDLFSPANDGLTPTQALLITYAVASDDQLADSAAHLRQRMSSIQANIAQLTGQSYPGPEGHLAYGPNGYVFSTPLDLVFDEQTVALLLERIAERSAR
jgi:hypothetical protein